MLRFDLFKILLITKHKDQYVTDEFIGQRLVFLEANVLLCWIKSSL